MEKKQTKCTYRDLTTGKECQAQSVHKGSRGEWEFYLCKKHKEVMVPLLSNKGLKSQCVESRVG